MNLPQLPLALGLLFSIVVQAKTTTTPEPDYSVTVNTRLNCPKDLSSDFDTDTLENQGFQISPNPIKEGICNLQYPSKDYTNISIAFVDLSGKRLFQKKVLLTNPQIDINNIPNGIYIAVITADKDRTILKVIKE